MVIIRFYVEFTVVKCERPLNMIAPHWNVQVNGIPGNYHTNPVIYLPGIFRRLHTTMRSIPAAISKGSGNNSGALFPVAFIGKRTFKFLYQDKPGFTTNEKGFDGTGVAGRGSKGNSIV